MSRTSLSHPLYINEVSTPSMAGVVGITFCPGKTDPHAMTGGWQRDVAIDVAAIAAWGADCVVTLIEEHEFTLLQVEGLGAEIEKHGISWRHLPIVDTMAPDARFEAGWPALRLELLAILGKTDGRVLVHCRGGLGRAGTLAALLLCEFGMSAAEAIIAVRSARSGAIETAVQEDYIRSFQSGRPSLHERAAGCLLGGAMGDALGWPVEFLSLSEIVAKYGENGIENLPTVGEITDDTQMTLFTAAGLCAARQAGALPHDISAQTRFVHRAYLDWLYTQGRLPAKLESSRLHLEIADLTGLQAERAPGSTCLSSLAAGVCGSPLEPINDSKGCGGVMRAAPVGLFYSTPVSASVSAGTVFAAGCATAAITHGNPSGYLPAGMLALIVWRLCQGGELAAAALEAIEICAEREGGEEAAAICQMALDAASGSEPIDSVGLGAGWTGHEALAIALCAALRYQGDFRAALRCAVNHSGDSDSTGSIAGNILGALYGKAILPADWLSRLELAGLIEDSATRLAAG